MQEAEALAISDAAAGSSISAQVSCRLVEAARRQRWSSSSSAARRPATREGEAEGVGARAQQRDGRLGNHRQHSYAAIARPALEREQYRHCLLQQAKQGGGGTWFFTASASSRRAVAGPLQVLRYSQGARECSHQSEWRLPSMTTTHDGNYVGTQKLDELRQKHRHNILTMFGDFRMPGDPAVAGKGRGDIGEANGGI